MKSIASYFLPVLFITGSFLISVCIADLEKKIIRPRKKTLFPEGQKLIKRYPDDVQIKKLVQSCDKVLKLASKTVFDCAAHHLSRNLKTIFKKSNLPNGDLETEPIIPKHLESAIKVFSDLEKRSGVTRGAADTAIPNYFNAMYLYLSAEPVSPNKIRKFQIFNSELTSMEMMYLIEAMENIIATVKERIEQYFGEKLNENLKVDVAAEVARITHGAIFYNRVYEKYLERSYSSMALEEQLYLSDYNRAWNITKDGIAVINILRQVVLGLPHPIEVFISKSTGEPVPLLSIHPEACPQTKYANVEIYNKL